MHCAIVSLPLICRVAFFTSPPIYVVHYLHWHVYTIFWGSLSLQCHHILVVDKDDPLFCYQDGNLWSNRRRTDHLHHQVDALHVCPRAEHRLPHSRLYKLLDPPHFHSPDCYGEPILCETDDERYEIADLSFCPVLKGDETYRDATSHLLGVISHSHLQCIYH